MKTSHYNFKAKEFFIDRIPRKLKKRAKKIHFQGQRKVSRLELNIALTKFNWVFVDYNFNVTTDLSGLHI